MKSIVELDTFVLLVSFPVYETLGVALIVAAGELTKASLSVIQLSRREKLHALDGSVLRTLGSGSIACLAIFFVDFLTSATHIYFQGVVIFAVYLLLMWLSMRFALPR